jgi:hypothetical protein
MLEVVLLHLRKCPVGGPSLVGDAINGGHRTRAMPATATVNEHWLICGIIDEGQELIGRLGRGPGLVAHWNSDELHACTFNQALFIGLPLTLEVYYRYLPLYKLDDPEQELKKVN